MKIESRNPSAFFLEDILNKRLPIIRKRIDLYNIESYKSFFILRNLKKENGKFRYLLKNIISEPLFLIYAYKTLASVPGNITPSDLISKITLDGIDVDWFFNTSKKLKQSKFKWSFNRRAYMPKKVGGERLLDVGSPRDKIVQKAIYLAFLEIYENKLNYFSDHSHGFRLNRNCHSALHQIKFGWKGINWYIEFDIKKAFNSLKRNKLMELIKADIQDQALFSLLYKMFEIKTRDRKKILIQKTGVAQGNLLSLLLFNIYVTPLDNYAKTLIKTYNVGKRPKRNPEYDKLTSLTKEEKLKLSSYEVELKLEQLKRVYRAIPKYIYDDSFIRIKYIRYADDFIFGVLGKKSLAVKIKKKIIDYIQNDLLLEINRDKTKLTNIFNDSASFLSCKIHCTKRKFLSFSKPQAIEKRLRVMNRIKLRKKVHLDKIVKKSADDIWNQFKSNPNKFLAMIHHLKDHDFTPIKEEILNALKLNRRKGIRDLAKSLSSQISLTVEAVDKDTKHLFENIVEIQKVIENQNKAKQEAQNKVAEISTPLTKKYIVEFIKEYYGDELYINQYKASYLVKKLREKFPKLVWPSQIPHPIVLPPNLNLKKINDKNKMENLVDIIKFLEINQQNFDENIMISKIPNFSSKVVIMSNVSKTVQRARRPILNADLKSIYKKLREGNIINKNKMKAESKKSVLLSEDYEIISLFSSIARGILNYFSCCDNFSKVKSIILYFVRFSLAATLKHKRKMSSTHKVFKEYGEDIHVVHPHKKDRVVSFLTRHEINVWPKSFNKENINITNISPFENINKIVRSLNNSAIMNDNCKIMK